MVNLVFNSSVPQRRYGSGFFKKIISRASAITGLDSKKIELSVNLVGEKRIKALNQRYCERSKPTDILSFPLEKKITRKSAVSGIMSLGDIFICSPMAKKYAQQEGVSFDFKLALLAVHGFLHLLGYEHEKSDKKRKIMFGLQNKILESLFL